MDGGREGGREGSEGREGGREGGLLRFCCVLHADENINFDEQILEAAKNIASATSTLAGFHLRRGERRGSFPPKQLNFPPKLTQLRPPPPPQVIANNYNYPPRSGHVIRELPPPPPPPPQDEIPR